jgi:hypothetical protein
MRMHAGKKARNAAHRNRALGVQLKSFIAPHQAFRRLESDLVLGEVCRESVIFQRPHSLR